MKLHVCSLGLSDKGSKSLYKVMAEGGRILGIGENGVDRTPVALDELRGTAEKAQETVRQNAVRDALKKDIETQWGVDQGLDGLNVFVGKNDTLGAIAFAYDKLAKSKWQLGNLGETFNPKKHNKDKEIHITWSTPVEITRKGKTETVKLHKVTPPAHYIYPGEIVSFTKNEEGETVIHVSDKPLETTPKPIVQTPAPVVPQEKAEDAPKEPTRSLKDWFALQPRERTYHLSWLNLRENSSRIFDRIMGNEVRQKLAFTYCILDVATNTTLEAFLAGSIESGKTQLSESDKSTFSFVDNREVQPLSDYLSRSLPPGTKVKIFTHRKINSGRFDGDLRNHPHILGYYIEIV